MMSVSQQAVVAVNKAIKKGSLKRPNECELCEFSYSGLGTARIVAHHWNGYNNPLDIWWLCYSCNRHLAGFHDGSLSREQARVYIEERKRRHPVSNKAKIAKPKMTKPKPPFSLKFLQKLLDKQVVERRSIKLTEVAKETGLPLVTLSRYKKETPKKIDLDILDALCNYFNCKIEDLLVRTKNEP